MHTALAWAAEPRHPQRTVLQWTSLPHSLKTTADAVWLFRGDDFSLRQGVRARVDQLHPSTAGEAINKNTSDSRTAVDQKIHIQNKCQHSAAASDEFPAQPNSSTEFLSMLQNLGWGWGGCEASEFLVALWAWHTLHPLSSRRICFNGEEMVT